MSESMNNHITLDECIEVIYANKVDDEYLEKVSKVNLHIYRCEECRKMHTAIAGMKTIVERHYLQQLAQQEEKSRIFNAIQTFARQQELAVEKVKELFDKAKNFVDYISLKIPSLNEIGIIGDNTDYRHPVYLAFAKSTGGSDNEGKEAKAILINNYSNRISVEEDGTLSLVLSDNDCDEDSIVWLIHYDEEEAIMMALPRALDEDLYRVVFEDVVPGDYYIKISS